MKARKFISVFVMGIVSILLLGMLTACSDGGVTIKENSLGYDFVGQTLPGAKPRTITIPPSHAKPVNHLRMYGIGVPPEGFISQYGQALAPSQPPTQIWFKATLDAFPTGSVLIVGFDRSSLDGAPRANEISYVPGNNHPTTNTQAETIATSFLPDDVTGPTNVQKYDADNDRCQSETYTSPTLAKLFPPQDFLDGNGNTAKAGTVTLNLFPYYNRSTSLSGKPEEIRTNLNNVSVPPDNPDNVGSFLLTLGTKTYC